MNDERSHRLERMCFAVFVVVVVQVDVAIVVFNYVVADIAGEVVLLAGLCFTNQSVVL